MARLAEDFGSEESRGRWRGFIFRARLCQRCGRRWIREQRV